jgi:hypothetical protein
MTNVNGNSLTLNEKKKRARKRKTKYNSLTYTTGSIDLNIDRFNTAMGTSGLDRATTLGNIGSDCDSSHSEISGGSLTEAKRYVRRYYIRPQNIFCSNKAEILKALIELDDSNCSIYTLNNLGDEKDVTKLMNSDIIYYYDDGILYDKNRVKVMDYDLSIKKEENRKHFANVDKAPDKEFKNAYEDRMTDATELEESYVDALAGCGYDIIGADFTEHGDKFVVSLNHNISDLEAAANELSVVLSEIGIYVTDWNTNGSNVIIFDLDSDADENLAFNLTFEDYNVYGEKLTEAKENFCCICGEPIEGYGNNPEPFMSAEDGRCCDGCNLKFVLPARLEIMKGE